MTQLPLSPEISGCPILSLDAGAALLHGGGMLVYPTETYFAIGCLANNSTAAKLVASLKKRQPGKPMPIIAASLAQASLVAGIETRLMAVLQKFWPGPLTVILPAKAHLAPQMRDPKNRVALRVSSNELARGLARKSGWPIGASSANFSGHAPCATEAELDPLLLRELSQSGMPCGLLRRQDSDKVTAAAPSTIIEPSYDANALYARILRQGAVGEAELARGGFRIVD